MDHACPAEMEIIIIIESGALECCHCAMLIGLHLLYSVEHLNAASAKVD